MTKLVKTASRMAGKPPAVARFFADGDPAPALHGALLPPLDHVGASPVCRETVVWLSAALPWLTLEATPSRLLVSARGAGGGNMVPVATIFDPATAAPSALLKKFALESSSIPRETWGEGLRRRRDGYFALVSGSSAAGLARIVALHYGDLLFREALDLAAFGDNLDRRGAWDAIRAVPWPELAEALAGRLSEALAA